MDKQLNAPNPRSEGSLTMHIATRYILNIGLRFEVAGRSTGGQLTPGAALHELYGVLEQAPVKIVAATAFLDLPEPTYVVELDAAPSRRAIDNLATHLWQDCIAVYDCDTGEGDLIGPRADGWLPFKPWLFIMPNGQPLDREEPKGDAERPWPWPMLSVFDVPTAPVNPADTADFSTYEKRVELAKRGIYSIDRTAKRAQRSAEKAKGLLIEGAYEWLGLDRKRESSRIQSEVAGLLPEGIWPRSSGLYSGRMHALDQHVLARAERQGYAS